MFFDDKIEQNASGKNLESLRKSISIRNDFISKYGFVPNSILLHNRNKVSKIAIISKRRYVDSEKQRFKNVNRRFHSSGSGVRAGALSTFSQSIGSLIVNFYCPENGIVYDPFAGHNSRMELVYNANRNYIGVDVSAGFMKENRIIKEQLLTGHGFFKNDKTITLIEGSSAKVDLPDKIADFTITSPPYWDIEWYGDELKQLGKAKTYKEFLLLLSEHVKENFRILKNGSFCAWFVNDFVKNKVFYPYHADLITIFVDAGFEIFQIYIVDLGASLAAIFVQNIIKSKRFPKRHEYCLLFKKPEVIVQSKEENENKNSGVQRYFVDGEAGVGNKRDSGANESLHLHWKRRTNL